MDDLVPHVPLPPLAMKAIDFVVDMMADILHPVFPNLVPSLAGEYEYVHTGKLFFIGWNGDLVYSHRVVEYIEDWLIRTFGGEQEKLPGSPMPKWILDAARAAATVESIHPQITRGTFEFFRHHPMIHHLKCVKELGKRAADKGTKPIKCFTYDPATQKATLD